MQNINRWRSKPPFYFKSGQFDTRGLWVHNTNVVMSLNWFKRKKLRSGAYLFNYFSSLRKKISKKKSTILNREHQKFLALVLPKRQPHTNMSFKQLLIQDWCNFSVRQLFLKETRPYHWFQSHEYIVSVTRWIKFIEFLMCHTIPCTYLYLTSCSNMFFCNVLGLAAWDGINPDAVEKSDLCISTSSSIVMYW